MSAIKKYTFPTRLTAAQVQKAYISIEEAFAAHDHLYVARYARNNPELRGCALLLLGNRLGGEIILDKHDICTAQSCFYRGYAAWQDNDISRAREWISQGKSLSTNDGRFDKLISLMERDLFRIVFHCDFHSDSDTDNFKDVPGFEVHITHHQRIGRANALPPGQPLKSIIPKDTSIDLVLLDDLKMVPVGIGALNAPVVCVLHDHEYYYEIMERLAPEIDLLSVGATSEVIETGHAFGIPASQYMFFFHMNLPDANEIAQNLSTTPQRTTDLLYTGSIGHDFYRYKKQQVLSLSTLPERYKISIEEIFYPVEQLWDKMRSARFSIISSRTGNYLSTRALESLASGTFHLVDEESGIPYIFSEPFHCFPVYRREHLLADVERHLNSYDDLVKNFYPQIPQLVAELTSFCPTDKKLRIQRFLRHALFMTHVEMDTARWRDRGNLPPKREVVYTNELHRSILHLPEVATQFAQQTPASNPLRKAFALRSKLLIQGKSMSEASGELFKVFGSTLDQSHDSLPFHYALGASHAFLNQSEEADRYFKKITDGCLKISSDDPPPTFFSRPDSIFWISDVRIRSRCSKYTKSLASIEDIWKSFAWANRAEIALHKALRLKDMPDAEAIAALTRAADFARQSLALFPYNEAVQKFYLRAVFGLAIRNDSAAAQDFLESFEEACSNDWTILHDFAAPAFHLFTKLGRTQDAANLVARLNRYLSRVKMNQNMHTLHEEFIPYIQQYNIPHTRYSPDNNKAQVAQ